MRQSVSLTRSPQLRRRQVFGVLFQWLCILCALSSILILGVLMYDIVMKGWPLLKWDFLNSFASRRAEDAGIKAAIWGTIWLMLMTLVIATPVGIVAAIYLEEYARKNRLNTFIEVNIANLAGVPSIIYGILGLALFARLLGLGSSLVAGALTMSLLILPVIVISAREAIRAVPPSLREASVALGATKWQTTWRVVLPSALPGILTGLILSLSRAIGETAPLILIGVPVFIAFTPRNHMDDFTALPIVIFDWARRPGDSFQANAAAGILVLLIVLVAINSVAIYLRYHTTRRRKA